MTHSLFNFYHNILFYMSDTSSSRSLASLVGGGGRAPATVSSVKSVSSKPTSTLSPFATEATSNQLRSFDDMERELTAYMAEKTALEEELSRSSNY